MDGAPSIGDGLTLAGWGSWYPTDSSAAADEWMGHPAFVAD